MKRGGLWLAAALLIATPLDARCDDDTVVIQDASGRVLVVPTKSSTTLPKRTVPPTSPVPAARTPAPARAPAAPAREVADACAANRGLIESWQNARRRVLDARERLEAAESIPLVGMSGYRDARIAGAELSLDKAESQESAIDTRAHELGVPPRCFDEPEVDDAEARESYE